MTDPKRKYYEKRANVLIKNLHSRHFEACYCADKAEALKKALEWIPAGSSVGWGGQGTTAPSTGSGLRPRRSGKQS